MSTTGVTMTCHILTMMPWWVNELLRSKTIPIDINTDLSERFRNTDDGRTPVVYTDVNTFQRPHAYLGRLAGNTIPVLYFYCLVILDLDREIVLHLFHSLVPILSTEQLVSWKLFSHYWTILSSGITQVSELTVDTFWCSDTS